MVHLIVRGRLHIDKLHGPGLATKDKHTPNPSPLNNYRHRLQGPELTSRFVNWTCSVTQEGLAGDLWQ